MGRTWAWIAVLVTGSVLIGSLVTLWTKRHELGLAGGAPGTALLYENHSHAPPGPDLAERVASIMRQRAQRILRQPVQFEAQGPNLVEVRVPDHVPVAEVQGLLRMGAMLEFCFVVEDPDLYRLRAAQLRASGPDGTPPGAAADGLAWLEVAQGTRPWHRTETHGGKEWMLVYTTPDKSMMHGRDRKPWGLRRASPGVDPVSGRPTVSFEFDAAGSALFGELTGANIRRPLAILLDGKVLAVPVVQSRVEERGQIMGDLNGPQIRNIARSLDAGILPGRFGDVPVRENQTRIAWPISSYAITLMILATVMALATIGLIIHATRTDPAARAVAVESMRLGNKNHSEREA